MGLIAPRRRSTELADIRDSRGHKARMSGLLGTSHEREDWWCVQSGANQSLLQFPWKNSENADFALISAARHLGKAPDFQHSVRPDP